MGLLAAALITLWGIKVRRDLSAAQDQSTASAFTAYAYPFSNSPVTEQLEEFVLPKGLPSFAHAEQNTDKLLALPTGGLLTRYRQTEQLTEQLLEEMEVPARPSLPSRPTTDDARPRPAPSTSGLLARYQDREKVPHRITLVR
jgi:hypothetical protein